MKVDKTRDVIEGYVAELSEIGIFRFGEYILPSRLKIVRQYVRDGREIVDLQLRREAEGVRDNSNPRILLSESSGDSPAA